MQPRQIATTLGRDHDPAARGDLPGNRCSFVTLDHLAGIGEALRIGAACDHRHRQPDAGREPGESYRDR